ncbi:hypothetical protein V1525DRAFT_336978 [Lipomyces kononenkoae]|uniref:Uncharacterized protein n=1 Tax=Lipomyces kononenkoae TaxID=34357 RepID=A0ACC3T9U2_LIPKO
MPNLRDETATSASAEFNIQQFKQPDSSETSSADAGQPSQSIPTRSSSGKVDQVPAGNTSADEDKKLYIYTSFTGGGMFGRNIMTATNRLKLILKANNLAFEIVDLATNEQAKKLWARSSRGKKLPGVVKGKDIVGNYEDIEEANEFGEVQQLIAEFV